jgi:hypothetical protein
LFYLILFHKLPYPDHLVNPDLNSSIYLVEASYIPQRYGSLPYPRQDIAVLNDSQEFLVIEELYGYIRASLKAILNGQGLFSRKNR